MLRSLYIQNYALIEKLDIGFDSGFSVITGETGAGLVPASPSFWEPSACCWVSVPT